MIDSMLMLTIDPANSGLNRTDRKRFATLICEKSRFPVLHTVVGEWILPDAFMVANGVNEFVDLIRQEHGITVLPNT